MGEWHAGTQTISLWLVPIQVKFYKNLGHHGVRGSQGCSGGGEEAISIDHSRPWG